MLALSRSRIGELWDSEPYMGPGNQYVITRQKSADIPPEAPERRDGLADVLAVGGAASICRMRASSCEILRSSTWVGLKLGPSVYSQSYRNVYLSKTGKSNHGERYQHILVPYGYTVHRQASRHRTSANYHKYYEGYKRQAKAHHLTTTAAKACASSGDSGRSIASPELMRRHFVNEVKSMRR